MMKDLVLKLRVETKIIAAIDEWRATQRPIPNQSEAVRRLIEAGIAATTPKNIVVKGSSK